LRVFGEEFVEQGLVQVRIEVGAAILDGDWAVVDVDEVERTTPLMAMPRRTRTFVTGGHWRAKNGSHDPLLYKVLHINRELGWVRDANPLFFLSIADHEFFQFGA